VKRRQGPPSLLLPSTVPSLTNDRQEAAWPCETWWQDATLCFDLTGNSIDHELEIFEVYPSIGGSMFTTAMAITKTRTTNVHLSIEKESTLDGLRTWMDAYGPPSA
jgi:hypothetical protein